MSGVRAGGVAERRWPSRAESVLVGLSLLVVVAFLLPLVRLSMSADAVTQVNAVVESFAGAAFGAGFCVLALWWLRAGSGVAAWTCLLIAGSMSAALSASAAGKSSGELRALFAGLPVVLAFSLLLRYPDRRLSGLARGIWLMVATSLLIFPQQKWRPPLPESIVMALTDVTFTGLIIVVLYRLRSRCPASRRIQLPLVAVTLVLAATCLAGSPVLRSAVVDLIPLAVAVSVLIVRLTRARLGRDVLIAFHDQDPFLLRAGMRRAVCDPGLEIWLPGESAREWYDVAGQLAPSGAAQSIEPVTSGGRRLHRVVDGDGAVLALLDVDAATTLEQPGLLRAASDIARIGLENTRLDARLTAEIRELKASHGRIVTVLDEQRRHVAELLRTGADAHLAEAERILGRKGATQEAVGSAKAQVRAGLDDLRAVARGLRS